MPDRNPDGDAGVLAYVAFLIAAVFIGPLEAVLAVALYWLFDHDEDEPATANGAE
ncbi:hypothetical protein G9464_12655 [Halostella sp. JP-L12]|uniref:hypothetical protein n=1 Tax=Halostella TaxID=1843185 RepID=UPI0013CE74E0|nr:MULTISPECIES: hypothetical protein [Halostella]NHN48438.1 hypothetical protein [Halostella sp. JP-L12]